MPQPPEELPDSIVFAQFEGLKNTVNPERLKPTELARAVNVDIDDAGQVHRRRGYVRKDAANYHSVFTAQSGTVYGVRNGSLGIIDPSYSFRALVTGIAPEPLAYVEVGPDIFYSSAMSSGVLVNGTSNAPWGIVGGDRTWLSPVVNPTSTLGEVGGKLLGPPPMATSLTYFNGRVYMASQRTVWATELYAYHFVDKTKNFLFWEDDVTLLAAVTDGIYVGTESSVWFMSGTFGKMSRVPVVGYGALRGSAVTVPAELVVPNVPLEQQAPSKNAVLFMTTSGLVAGFDGGNAYNLTQNTVLFPDAQSVAALFRRQDGVNQYIAVSDSGGSPASNTRMGDYVDAEIRRFQGA